MPLVAEYRLKCTHLPLVNTASAVPSVDLALKIGQPNQGSLPPFFVRASGNELDRLEREFDRESFVGEYTEISSLAQTRQYQIIPAVGMVKQLEDVVDDPNELKSLATNHSVVKNIHVVGEGWVQERWFAHRDAFDEYRMFWQDNGVGISVERLYRSTGKQESETLLTDRQREAVVTAYEMGYFDIPRSSTHAEVADSLGISPPSLSERLRRAYSRLIEGFLKGTK